MDKFEYDSLTQPIWGEVDLLQEVIDRSFKNITDEDFDIIKDWFGIFCGSRGRHVEIVEIEEGNI